ncbi:Ribose-5-phosphate isomerase [Labeo rohita]|uniref:Ribose-5-phosphate isomerase n=1 Tax=Labeo rohita TaxID=84645 RepID=A0ABQ8L0X8_LABRO|nr:Ribose-5-phosphate isomerase [Labeo rohita]
MVWFIRVSALRAAPDDFNVSHVFFHIVNTIWITNNASFSFTVSPSYERWAPWIGSETCRSGTVLNTEFKKSENLSSVTEDHLIDELAKQKVMLPGDEGNMKSRQTYDKVFQSIWGAPGKSQCRSANHVPGTLQTFCSPGSTSQMSVFMILQEVWQHTSISPLFQPYEGRLMNVKAAGDVSLLWLHESVHCGKENAHPVTGSSEHYVLYDCFHEKNATKPKDVLHRIQLVPEPNRWLNSRAAKQFFAKMHKSKCFFNNTAPSTHVFLMRCYPSS